LPIDGTHGIQQHLQQQQQQQQQPTVALFVCLLMHAGHQWFAALSSTVTFQNSNTNNISAMRVLFSH
jgi:hypothetical protein